MVFFPDIQLAAGHDNTAGLTAIETVLAGFDSTTFPGFPGVPPSHWGRFTRGGMVIRGNGLVTFRGYPTTEWPFGFLSRAQVRGLMDTYCGGSYSGLVTVRMHTDDPDNYENYNAVMILPQLSEIQPNQVKYNGFLDYVVRLTRMVIIPTP